MKRVSQILTIFALLIISMLILNMNFNTSKAVQSLIKFLVIFNFGAFCFIATLKNGKDLKHIHAVKIRDHYEYDESDLRFDKKGVVTKVVGFCFIASILAGVLGIAGGIILSPVFLSLGILPSVTAATNQYIGLISTMSVSL